MALRIRDAAAADAPAISDVARRSWPAAYEGLFEPEFIELVLQRTYDPAHVAERIEDPGSIFLVAENGERVIGFLHYTEGELHRIYLEPDEVGAGGGTLLLEELERRLSPGTEYIALVRGGNERALAFYRRRGFEQAEIVDGFRHFAQEWGLDLPPGPPRDVLMRRRVPVVRS